MKVFLDTSRDYRYYAEKGWLESDFFYPTHLGPMKGQRANSSTE